MTKAIANIYDSVSERRVKLVYCLLLACLFAFLSYTVNVFTVISRTVAIQKVEDENASLSASLESLDAEYLTLEGQVTPDSLSAHGLSQGQISAYIPRLATTAIVASLNGLATSDHGF
ncbi:MAG: hypothetical protein WCT02_00870 [Candidatus Paceibacterota bacterium]